MKYRKGITILELVLAIALFGLVMIPITNLFVFGKRAQASTVSEFDTQSNIRLISENVNTIIRDATGIYLLDKSYPSDDSIEAVNASDHFTDGWNYLMLNKAGTELVEWVWDGAKHTKRIIINSIDGLRYNLTYEKYSPSNEDNLLFYDLNINYLGNEREIKTELSGLNTLQIIDRSYGNVANTLSYRYDSRINDIGMAQAAVSFVIDTSGSMSSAIAGGTRISVLKARAKEMVKGLAENENVWLSLSPFNNTANNGVNNNFNNMLPLKETESSNGISTIIDSLGTGGGTNTGDGMRRGYHSIVDFNNLTGNINKITKNFMIILVDGESTYATGVENINDAVKEDVKWDWFTPLPAKEYVITNAGTPNERRHDYSETEYILGIPNKYVYRYKEFKYFIRPGDSNSTVIGNQLPYNTNYSEGRVFGPGNKTNDEVKGYVSKIGEEIYAYKKGTDSEIDVFIIGFAGDANSNDLQHIATSTKTINGTEGNTYKYYKANTSEALKTILDEIKFHVSEALWHIGGPN